MSPARASTPSRSALRPHTAVLEARAHCPNSVEPPAPAVLERKPKIDVPCDDHTTRSLGAVPPTDTPGNSRGCTGFDAGSANREWLAVSQPADAPASASHLQVIRSYPC